MREISAARQIIGRFLIFLNEISKEIPAPTDVTITSSIGLNLLPMHTRLLSFLSDFECSLAADDPAPSDGSWETSRTVNYNQGLARLILGVRLPDKKMEPRGSIMLQSYLLADESTCLKAVLTWAGSESKITRSIYAKPDINWVSEARKAAAEWMAGPPAKVEPLTEEQGALTGNIAAAG